MRVNPGDALDCSLYGDLRIAEEEPEEEPEEEFRAFSRERIHPLRIIS